MRIYLASPFFQQKELEKVKETEIILTRRGIDFFSPRLHEVRDQEAGSPAWAEEVFRMDRDAIQECDRVLVLYHGGYGDTGTAWECGYAYAIGKPVVVVLLGDDANLMITGGSSSQISFAELETYDFETLPRRKYEGPVF